MSVEQDVRKIFAKLPDVFVPERAGDLKATIQVVLSGEGASSWVIKINDGTLTANEGQTQNPDMTLRMEAKDYVDLTLGRVNPLMLFKDGKIKTEGNMGLALKFPMIFDRSRAE